MNIYLKSPICIKIEELTSNDDLNTNRKEVVSLQLEWKKINPVPYKINQKNWKKFKTICDVFFNKINHQKSNQLIKKLQKSYSEDT